MPNYVTTIINFPADRIEEIRTKMKGDKNEFDFNNLIPCPETFTTYDTTNHPFGRGLEIGDKHKDPYTGEEIDITEGLIEEYKRASEYQQDRYGVVGWYDWNCRNWGTKWNSCGCKWGSGSVIIDTAWSFPEPVINALAKAFPDIEFSFIYADEDTGYNTGRGYASKGLLYLNRPENGSDEAMENYLATHEWAREEIYKDENGKWVSNDD